MTKLLCSFWLLLSCLFLQAGPAMSVSASCVPAWQAETASGGKIDYEVQNDAAESKYDYDTASIRSTGEKKLASSITCPLIGNFVEFVAAEGGTTLYRAVGPAELADIQANGILRNLGSAEGKYFTTSAEAASSYAKQAVQGFGDPAYTIIQTKVPNSIFEGLTPSTVDRGIPAWVIPNNRLPGLTPEVLPSMPIPRHP